ncbi:MAG: hypothetical protein K2I44_03835 [Muribaculaceae bacterium]|nr:hypothetical protein [Muribaculaceae bacterium]
MNKRSLLNLAMCSLLLGSLPVGLVGCKDYDGDIKDLNTTTGDLSSQLSSLKTALDAAQNAATAAANDAKAAAEKADNATAEVALAKKAAEEAKAEAIAAAIAEVEKLQSSMSDMNAETAKELSALSGRIDGIQADLNKIDMSKVEATIGELSGTIAEANKQLEAVKVQVAALEKYQEAISKLQGDVADLKGKVAAIETIKADLAAVQAKASANAAAIQANATAIGEAKTAITEIKAELGKLSAAISTQVSNAVNSIAGILSQRLTSVTLVPELYVGGIPTIEFESARYTKQVLKGGKWQAATEGQTQFVITNNATTAQYRLNPGTLKTEDIDVKGMEYVTKIATTRAADPTVVTVSNAKVEDNGLLTVNLGKATTTSLNLTGNKIYTVSLKVPVASKHLFEGEASADVYSEFTRLSETYFQPKLNFVKDAALMSSDGDGHLWNDSTVLYTSAAGAYVAKNIVYNETLDLNTLVEGCKFFSVSNHPNISVDKLAEYGLGIKYAVATKAYTPTDPDNTNQQVFAKIDGSILTPIAASGATDNENIIGKQPIIRATLYDLNNNNVIEVGYFKVKFTAADMNPEEFEIVIESEGQACTGASAEYTWDRMAKEVLEELNNKQGMSKNDFYKIYTPTQYTYTNATMGTTLKVYEVGELNASTPVMTWTATAAELGVLSVGENPMEYPITVTFKNYQGLYPDVILNFKWKVNTKVGALSLGTTNPIKWTNNTMKVTVVPMGIPYDGSQTAVYNTNILEGRNKPYVKGLLSCAQYNIEYAPQAQQSETYLGEPLTGFNAWELTNETQRDLNAVNYVIANTAAGKNLASKGGTIKVNFNSDINGLTQNRSALVGSINLQVVPILSLETTTASGITDNSSEVSMNLTDNLVIKDAYKNVVAKSNTAANEHAGDYWKFYVIENPVFDASNIKVAATKDGANASTLASLNMTANIDNASGKLTFQNNGSAIVSDAYLIVPVKVAHKWGVLKGTVAVPLKAKL